MAILGVFTKQPADIQDYDFDYSQYLTGLSDTILTATVVADDGIIVSAHQVTNPYVKVWLAGGTHNQVYKITVTVETVGGRTKQSEIKVKVKEY